MPEKPPYDMTSKESIPLHHYTSALAALDPGQVSARTGVPYDPVRRVFTTDLAGEAVSVAYPSGEVTGEGGRAMEPAGAILTLRRLCGGVSAPSSGKWITYRGIPAGDTYYRQFEGRCLKRLAYSYGSRPEAFLAGLTAMGGKAEDVGDVSASLALTGEYSVLLAIWLPDEEFGPSSQILFSDNFAASFTAEDAAVAVDVILGRLRSVIAQKQR